MDFYFYSFSMNYFGYDPKLNVYRVEDLVEEIYAVYTPSPDYEFCSIDVVSMFDRIDMEGVISVVRLLGVNFAHGLVNMKQLVSLIQIDRKLFDFFKYISPRTLKGTKPRYFHQCSGIPMGGNTSNMYADIYVSYHLAKIRSNLDRLGVLFLRKYVDDFLIYAPRKNMLAIKAIIEESLHLSFTIEYAVDGKLPYLDLLLRNVNGRLSTSW